MSDYSQARSFNLGIAQETSVEAALIYNDLAYFSGIVKGAWFYRSYEQMLIRLPMMSESTCRRAIKALVDGGWISTKVMKVNGTPTMHFQIDRSLSVKMTETKETVKMTDSINKTIKETIKSNFVFDGSNNSAQPAAARADLLETIIAIINPKEKVTSDRLAKLNGRLKDYTSDEIIGSARAFSKSQWHRENKQMSVDNLLAPSKFGRWYAVREDSQVPDGVTNFKTAEVTIANQDEMVRRRMGGEDGAN